MKSKGRLTPTLHGFLVVLSAGAFRFALSPLPGYDVRDYRIWAEVVARGGATVTYHAEIFNRYNYPPGFLYILDAVNRLYGLLSPSFDASSPLFALLLKTPGILTDAAIALAIYWFVLSRASSRSALIGSLAYALNPAVIWNTGYWGGIDSINSLFALLSAMFLLKGQPKASWSALALSLLTKPLNAPVAIVVAFLTLTRFGIRRIVHGFAAGALTALIIVAPFLVTGAFGDMWTAITGNLGHYDNISVNAHNFWWLASGGYGWTKDTGLLLGLVSYRAIGFAFFALLSLWCLYLLWKRPQEELVFGVSAYLSFAFFMLFTEVHENWMFGVFPFLVVAAVLAPRFRPVLIALTVTFWLNMALHDLSFGYDLPSGFLGSFLAFARLANSFANVVILVYGACVTWRVFHSAKLKA